MTSTHTPVGLLLAQTAKTVGRAFEDALAAAGGSTATWLVLLSLTRDGPGPQTRIAETVGVRGPTLTHHLAALEARGLIQRTRTEADRRAHAVALTEQGREMFHRLREEASA